MPTKNPRVNITFDEAATTLLINLAKQKNTSVSKIARELVLEALEQHEDIALSAIAKIRDTKKTKKIDHRDAWK